MSISYFAECTVLITGASAGLGREFARQLAPVVSTMVLVARRHERLETLALELKVINPDLELFSRPVDLGNEAELRRFADWLDESGLAIDLLVNNAGLGDQGPFADGQWDRIESMLRVNVYALTYLIYRILPRMQKAGCGAILNVSSVASFLPLPNMAVYAASKAYVTSFSEALRAELRGVNISVTTLCPGPVLTEFSQVAHRTTGVEAKAPEAFLVPAQDVVRSALNGVARDRARVVPGALVHLVMTVVAFVPMFIKRLVYQIQLNEPSRATRESERNYETTVAR